MLIYPQTLSWLRFDLDLTLKSFTVDPLMLHVCLHWLSKDQRTVCPGSLVTPVDDAENVRNKSLRIQEKDPKKFSDTTHHQSPPFWKLTAFVSPQKLTPCE